MYDNDVAEASDIRFYFKGGRDVIAMSMYSDGFFSVFPLPAFSGNAHTVMDMETEVMAEMGRLGIQRNQSFLFDLKNKVILSPDESFIDYVPCWDVESAVFVLIDRNGEFSEKIYVPEKTALSDWKLQFLLAVVSRQWLSRPQKNSRWTKTGKMFLTYNLHKEYGHPGDFSTKSGLWDRLDLTVPLDAPGRGHDMKKLKLDRAVNLAAGLLSKKEKATPFDEPPEEAETADAVPSFMSDKFYLAEITQMGFPTLLGKGLGVIEVVVDMLNTVIKSFIFDTDTGECLVELYPNTCYDIDDIKTSLGYDNIRLADEPKFDPSMYDN